MPKVKYVGDPDDEFSGPREIKVKGRTYHKDVEVDESNEDRYRHLRGHTHFETEDGFLPAKTAVEDKFLEGSDDDDGVEVVVVYTEAECQAILNDRGVKFKKTDDLNALIDKVDASGGFPTDDPVEK